MLNFFDIEPLQIKCFFHFVKSIREKIKKIISNKKGLNKEAFTILNNIELISFIDLANIEKYKKFLLEEINKFGKYEELIKYLKRFWFSKNSKYYNYSEFIKKYYNNKKAMEKLYLTNNIIESLHAKLNYFLPRHVTNQYNFVNAMKNILINDSIINSRIKRKDFKTKSLIMIIEKEKINEHFKWVTYEQFKLYLKKIIDENTENIKEDDSNNLMKLFDNEFADILETNDNNIDSFNNENNSNKILNENDKDGEDISDNEQIEKEVEKSENVEIEEDEMDLDIENDANNNNELISLMEILNINDEEDIKNESSNISINNKNNISNYLDNKNLIYPLRDRVKNKIKSGTLKKTIQYPKVRKRKNDYSSDDEENSYSKDKKRKSLSRQKKKI